MNLVHIKYAVEVAETGSLNKAAEKLIIGQPNLSRAVKELETSLGIKIFERSAKGMTLTPEGETFMSYAKNILMQVDALEETFTKGLRVKHRFAVSVPRAGYISEAFARFSVHLNGEEDTEVYYRETGAANTVNNILQDDYRLGVIRYEESYDKYYKSLLEEKGLNYEMIAEFRYVIVMNKNCPLASLDVVSDADLAGYTEIAHADPYVPLVPAGEKGSADSKDGNRICVFERASQLAVLSANKRTYMRVSPISKNMLDSYGLVQRSSADSDCVYKDVLIYKKGYNLTKLDSLFIEELIKSKRDVLK